LLIISEPMIRIDRFIASPGRVVGSLPQITEAP
jgi:hypothetical protein